MLKKKQSQRAKYNKVKLKEFRIRNRKAKLCIDCNDKAEPDKQRCVYHLAYQRYFQRERRKKK